MGSYALGILFFMSSVHQNFTGKSSGRADRIVYGRYMSCALGLLVFLGVYVLVCRKDLFGLREKIVSICGYGIIFLLFAFKVTPWLGTDYIQRNIGVAAVFLKFLKQYAAENSDLMAKSLTLFGVLMFLVFLVMLLLSHGKQACWICVMSISAGTVLFLYHANALLLKKHEKVMAQMQEVYECISSCGDIYTEYPVVWVSSGVHAPLKAYQVLLMDYDLVNRKFQGAGGNEEMFMLNGELQDRSKYNFEDLDNMFVIAGSLPAVSELPEGDYYFLKGGEYDVKKQDVVYVKGKELKEEIEKCGFEMIPLSTAANE